MAFSVRLLIGVVGPVLSGLVLVLGLPAASAPAADAIALRIEVFAVAGIHVLTLHSNLEEAGNRYAINVDYATSGIAGLFVAVTTHAEVRGRLGESSAQPEAFRKDTRRNGADRHNKLEYRPDGTVEGGSTPPLPQPAPTAAGRGTVDNLTAYFMLERQLARTGSCKLSVPVFDGQFRYDLYFSDAGKPTLAPASGQNFAGATIACRMMRRYLDSTADEEQDEGARQGTIWYAKLIPGDLMVPVRMELETHVGNVTAYLAELHGRGMDLKLME